MNRDRTIAMAFLAATILLVVMLMTHEHFLAWAYDRHHNQWSWYIRPLFLIPFCYYSYQHRWTGISVTIFALITSMFWFPKPLTVNEDVTAFLNFEKMWLMGTWDYRKYLLAMTIPVSLFVLGLSFWKRSLPMGMAVVVLMAVGKIAWSVVAAGESGKSIIVPAVIGLMICAALIGYGFKRTKRR